VGVCCLIAGSAIPMIHFPFYCHPWHLWTYTSLVSAIFVAACVVVAHPRLQANHLAGLRVGLFFALGVICGTPVLHLLATVRIREAAIGNAVLFYVVMALAVLAGAVVYALQWPEKRYPGRFNVWCNSHAIFHVSINVSTAIHVATTVALFRWRAAHPHCGGDETLEWWALG
jgi:adiponectin receptor